LDERSLKLSPRARRLAQDLGIALSELAALGKGTVHEDDVRALFARRGVASTVEEDEDATGSVGPPNAAAEAAPEIDRTPVGKDEAVLDNSGALAAGIAEDVETAPDNFEALVAGTSETAPLEEEPPDESYSAAIAADRDAPEPADAVDASAAAPAVDLTPELVMVEEMVPITPIRRIIAERAVVSAREVPQFSCWIDVAAGPLLAVAADPLEATAVWVWAVARVLCAHRRLNATYTPEGIRLHAAVHVGVTLPLEDGIVVPVCHDADRKSIAELAEELRDREDRAQTRRLRGEQLLGATFTLSDWNTFGIRGGVPLVHPPQVATLGIGSPRDVPVLADGGLLFRRTVEVVLVADQRALDAAHAAAFLTALKGEIERGTGG
jgi:pyruvate/2-oxoglutarate dehydrogenase complex dihydrolipoamide acyltransferase (E2) component